MADKSEHAQVLHRRQKYKNPEYDDRTVESLMKYLDIESYEQLEDFLEYSHIPNFN